MDKGIQGNRFNCKYKKSVQPVLAIWSWNIRVIYDLILPNYIVQMKVCRLFIILLKLFLFLVFFFRICLLFKKGISILHNQILNFSYLMKSTPRAVTFKRCSQWNHRLSLKDIFHKFRDSFWQKKIGLEILLYSTSKRMMFGS